MTGTALVQAEKTLININAARTALAKAVRFDEVKNIHDLAVSAMVYARLAKDDEMLNNATEIKLRAGREAGAKLIAMGERGERLGRGGLQGRKVVGAVGPRGKGGKRVLTPNSGTSTLPSLADLGVTSKQSVDWQNLARQPEEKFEKVVADAKAPRARKSREPDDDAPTREEINDANTTARSRIFLRFAADTLRKLEHGAGLKKSKRNEISPEIKKALNDLVRACTKLRDEVINRKE